MTFEGGAPAACTAADVAALKVWNFCATGMGGIDWGHVPLACAYYGIDDVDMLIHRLLVIKGHKPPEVPGGADRAAGRN